MTRQIDRLYDVLAKRILEAQSYGYNWAVGQVLGNESNDYLYSGQNNSSTYGNVRLLSQT